MVRVGKGSSKASSVVVKNLLSHDYVASFISVDVNKRASVYSKLPMYCVVLSKLASCNRSKCHKVCKCSTGCPRNDLVFKFHTFLPSFS